MIRHFTIYLSLLVCFVSCQNSGYEHHLRGSFERGQKRIQMYSRQILPDTLVSFFPSVHAKDASLILQEDGIFMDFPKANKHKVYPLPWFYSEKYHYANPSLYCRAKQTLLNRYNESLDGFGFVYSYHHLWDHFTGRDPLPEEQSGSQIYIPDSVEKCDSILTLVVSRGYERILQEGENEYRYYQESSMHGHSIGISLDDQELNIQYWLIIW